MEDLISGAFQMSDGRARQLRCEQKPGQESGPGISPAPSLTAASDRLDCWARAGVLLLVIQQRNRSPARGGGWGGRGGSRA